MNNNKQSGKSVVWFLVIVVIAAIAYFVLSGDSLQKQPVMDTGNMMPAQSYTLDLKNISDTQALSPGVIVFHNNQISIDYVYELAPASLESLAEVGDPTAFAAYLETQDGVDYVMMTDAPILPGQSVQVEVPKQYNDSLVSVAMMAVGTNDGIAGAYNGFLGEFMGSINYDAGFEENTELLSGFDGGQPDPARGAENINNGTPTDPQAPVDYHPQLERPILEINTL